MARQTKDAQTVRKIFCCGCSRDVQAHLVRGDVVYPHRTDLADLPFWRCPTCGNFVGCHHKTDHPTKPLGVIATPEIKKERIILHSIMDRAVQQGLIRRAKLYQKMAKALGLKEFHSAQIRSVEQAKKAKAAAMRIVEQLGHRASP